MIPNYKNREVIENGVAESQAFGISRPDEAHIMGILRNRLYSDKVLAVLREYSANAWDAHRMTGKADLPINVVLPTGDEPTLVIRDFGPGLSHEDVFNIYTQYGASTKRDNNVSVGMLGIGSKSGFAYGDSFMITSWHGGIKRVYNAVLDKTNKGKIDLLYSEERPLDETGIEIKIAVRPSDIGDFTRKAQQLFRYFEPRPVINTELPPPPARQTKLVNGAIRQREEYVEDHWIAIMGCVPYRVDIGEIDADAIGDFLPKIVGTLYFSIGDVEINASREGLEYSDRTKQALVDKINDLVDEYVTHALDSIKNTKLTMWEARLRVCVLSDLELPMPDEWAELAKGNVKVEYDDQLFSIVRNTHTTNTVTVNEATRMIIFDDKRDIRGFNLGSHDYLVKPFVDTLIPKKSVTVDECALFLDEALEKAELTGITIVKLSTLAWTEPYDPKKQRRSMRTYNPKHRVKVFVLSGEDSSFAKPYSDHWNLVEREPTDDDVWIAIEGFESVGAAHSLFVDYRMMRRMAKAFGRTLPTIYGYKSTEAKPIDPKKIVGVHYDKWRETFLDSLITPEVISQINLMFWREALGSGGNNTPMRSQVEKLAKTLGIQHPLVGFFAKVVDPVTQKNSFNDEQLKVLAHRAKLTQAASEPTTQLNLLYTRYPLLHSYGFKALWEMPNSWHSEDEKAKMRVRRRGWREYVQMVDNYVDGLDKPVSPGGPILKLIAGGLDADED